MPDLIIYNAGTDILSGDPLGRLRISPNVSQVMSRLYSNLLMKTYTVFVKGIAKRDEIVFRYAKENDISIVMLLRFVSMNCQ